MCAKCITGLGRWFPQWRRWYQMSRSSESLSYCLRYASMSAFCYRPAKLFSCLDITQADDQDMEIGMTFPVLIITWHPQMNWWISARVFFWSVATASRVVVLVQCIIYKTTSILLYEKNAMKLIRDSKRFTLYCTELRCALRSCVRMGSGGEGNTSF